MKSTAISQTESNALANAIFHAFSTSVMSGKLNISELAKALQVIVAERSPACSGKPHNVKHILIIKLDEIGDMVLLTPFLRELRRNEPFAHISVLTQPNYRNLLKWCPYINQLYSIQTWDRGKTKSFGQIIQDSVRFYLEVLRHGCFDQCIVARYDHDYYFAGVLAALSGAAVRIAFSEKTTPWKEMWNSGYDAFYTRVLPPVAVLHEAERNLSIIPMLGGVVKSKQLELWTDYWDEAWAEQHLTPLGNRPLVVMAVGMPNQHRYWPVERYAEIACWLIERFRFGIVLLGSAVEQQMSQQLRESLSTHVVDLTGKTTLRQAAAVLRCCKLYFGRDTGLMHIAAAVNVPVVEVSPHPLDGSPHHPNNPDRFSPHGVPACILQPARAVFPCRDGCDSTEPHCILTIGVEQVKRDMSKFLDSIDIHTAELNKSQKE